MRYAIYSDVHGNLHALQAVLDDIVFEGADRIVCLGDLIGYGAYPNEVVMLTSEHADFTIAGNHDHAAIGLTDVSFFNEFAYRAVIWTRNQLNSGTSEWLREQPLSKVENELQFVHASPQDPADWPYIFSSNQAQIALEYAEAPIVMIGHTHVPFDFVTENGRMINVGSVGQPRDGDPRAAYTLFDMETGQRTLKRVPYDIDSAMAAIRDAGLPSFLADRLQVGR